MLAALPLGSGRPIADPFEPTAALRAAVLELRRDADRRRGREGPAVFDGFRALLRGRLSHA